ncbi:MAG TPA: DsrE family protein [Nitrospiraceae bacterium]|nr:DsrE family protein [Nitrospiraceae bacterium]
MAVKKLGILLSTPPTHPSVNTVAGLCQEALSQGMDLYVYFIDEGVKNLRDPRYLDLVNRGLKLFVCAYGCQQHEVSTEAVDTRISLCGLVVLSNIVNGCDRFLAFT